MWAEMDGKTAHSKDCIELLKGLNQNTDILVCKWQGEKMLAGKVNRTRIHSDVRRWCFPCSKNINRFIFLLISVPLKNIKTTQCPTPFDLLPWSLLKYIPCRKTALPPKKQQLISSKSALNDSYTLLRELETLALFRSRPLSVYAALRSRGI